jgi:hypothetical protein
MALESAEGQEDDKPVIACWGCPRKSSYHPSRERQCCRVSRGRLLWKLHLLLVWPTPLRSWAPARQTLGLRPGSLVRGVKELRMIRRLQAGQNYSSPRYLWLLRHPPRQPAPHPRRHCPALVPFRPAGRQRKGPGRLIDGSAWRSPRVNITTEFSRICSFLRAADGHFFSYRNSRPAHGRVRRRKKLHNSARADCISFFSPFFWLESSASSDWQSLTRMTALWDDPLFRPQALSGSFSRLSSLRKAFASSAEWDSHGPIGSVEPTISRCPAP